MRRVCVSVCSLPCNVKSSCKHTWNRCEDAATINVATVCRAGAVIRARSIVRRVRAILVELTFVDRTEVVVTAPFVHTVDNTLVESEVAPAVPTFAFAFANGADAIDTALLRALFNSVAEKSIRANGIVLEEPAISLRSTDGRQTRVLRHTVAIVSHEFALEASVAEVITASEASWAETLVPARIATIIFFVAKAGSTDGTIEAAAVDAASW